MKNNLMVVTIIIFLFSDLSYSQNCIALKGNIGYFITNTDNTLPVTDSKNIKYGWGSTIGYEHQLTKNYSILIEPGYYSAKVNDASKFILYGPQSGVFNYSVDLSQNSLPIDISLLRKLNEFIEIGIGLSLEGINHNLTINLPINRGSFEDRINIFAMGGNIVFQLYYPIPSLKRIFFIGDLKLRYLKSIWESENGRNLENYNYNYLQSIINIGVGYNI
ncbi:MAG: hypothetical protein ACYCVH_15530 [Ignavibacteriaceae bacterium]